MISTDCGSIGALGQEISEGARDTEISLLVVCERRSTCTWAPVPEKGVGHLGASTLRRIHTPRAFERQELENRISFIR